MHLPIAMRNDVKRLALDHNTTMGELIRRAVTSGLDHPSELAEASLQHRRVGGGTRTTLDLPRDTHRRLKLLAADKGTSVQALVFAAILKAHPTLA